MTILVRRPCDQAQLQSYLLGLEVLWPFQVAVYAGDVTAPHCVRGELQRISVEDEEDGNHI